MDRHDPRLIEYLLGTASPDDQAAVEAALADPLVSAELKALRELLGAVGTQGAPAPAPASLRDRVVASIASSELAGYTRRAAAFLDLEPGQTRELLASLGMPDQADWEPTGFAGIRTFELPSGPRLASAERCVAIHMMAGSQFPEHQHGGDEWGLVLQGQLLQNDGKRFGPGDLVHQAKGSSHAFVATDDIDVLQLVVLHGAIQFV